jgi:hypothetical protein
MDKLKTDSNYRNHAISDSLENKEKKNEKN